MRAAMKVVAARPGSIIPAHAGSSGTLESLHAGAATPPRVEAADPLETPTIGVVRPAGEPEVGFAAFLDGIQRSTIVGHFGNTIPVVHGTVAAAIRARAERVLRTWGTGARVEHALFVPIGFAPAGVADDLRAAGFIVIDTTPSGESSGHPHELLGFARQAIQQRREEGEAALAAEWCAAERAPLYVDGGIGAYATVAQSAAAVGVIKSHHTLYVEAPLAPLVAGLGVGERTTAFLVSTRKRTRVASWYLRLRPGDGIDPFSGIVRVEVAEGGFSPERAERVSSWILAEREPVALPDPRWRVMAYGVRDCEQYLRAVAG